MRILFRSMIASGAMLVSGAGLALAAPNPDLQVQLQAPSSVAISTATVYTAVVTNIGNATASSVQLTFEFPLTNTSPTVTILGTVSGLDSHCQRTGNTVSCSGFGTLKKGKSLNVSYTYTAPVSTKQLLMKATAVTPNDSNANNNSATKVPNLTYPTRAITTATMNNSHCTGQALTSYFECLLYPSSISSHVTTFDIGGSIGFSEPGYTGTWSQNAAKTSLFFEYFEGADKVVEFNGYAINGLNCFDGLTTFFPQPSAYVSPYRVCIQ